MSSTLQSLRSQIAARKGTTGTTPTPTTATQTTPNPAVIGQLQGVTQQVTTTSNQQAVQQLRDAMDALNREYFVAPDGGRALVWRETKDHELNKALLVPMSPTDFKALHVNQKFSLTNANGNTTTVSLGHAWFTDRGRRQYLGGMALLPEQDTPAGVYNLWMGWGVTPAEGDVEKPLWHIKHVVCNGDETLTWYLIHWMAWAVQNPGKQAEVAVVLQGAKGTGKGTLGRWLRDIFGAHGLHILHRRHLVGNFNAHLRSLCFAFADESFFAGDHEAAAVLKGIITEDQITIERKGVDAYAVRNRLKVMMATNEAWVVPASEDERRYFVLEVSDCRRGDHKYFGDLDKHMSNGGLAALLHYLLNIDLADFNIRRVPNTAALEQQKILSLEPLAAWLHDILNQGYFAQHEECWKLEQSRDGLSNQFAEHVSRQGKRHVRTSADAVGKGLREILPTLEDKRGPRPQRQRLWVFPPLDVARQQFSQHFNLEHTLWPEVEA